MCHGTDFKADRVTGLMSNNNTEMRELGFYFNPLGPGGRQENINCFKPRWQEAITL